MTKKIKMMTEEDAELIIQPLIDWLNEGAHGTNIDEKHCFGTIPQDLALGFAQDILESVGIDTAAVVGMAYNLASGNLASENLASENLTSENLTSENLASGNSVAIPCIKTTIH